MKKLTLFATLFALLLGACTPNELDNITPEVNNVITLPDLTAGFADDETTKTYVEESKYLRWHEADLITAFFGNTLNRQYKFKGKTGDNSGTFSLVPSGELGTGNALDAIYAIYPYNENTTISDKGVISFTLPAIQTYAENSFGKGANTMIAVTAGVEDTFLPFKNACGYLKLQLYNAEGKQLRSIEIKGNNEEKIAGDVTATIEFGENPTLTMSNDATTSVTLNCGVSGIKLGTTAETATELWVVLPEITFEGGITITAIDTDGLAFQKSTTNPVAITRNDIQPMAVLEATFVESPDIVVPSIIIYTTSDGQIIEPTTNNGSGKEYFDAKITSNTYDNGVGVITFDNRLTTLDPCAFTECLNLESLTLPNSVKNVQGVFKNKIIFEGKNASKDGRCFIVDGKLIAFVSAYLTEYTIPEGVTAIGDYVFRDCESLTKLNIPESVVDVGVGIFSGCTSLSKITGDNVSADGRCLVIDGVLEAFVPSGLTKYTVPEGVTAIGDGVFNGADIYSVTIPSTISTIGTNAFGESTIGVLNCQATTPPTTSELNLPNNTLILVPEESVNLYKNDEYWGVYVISYENCWGEDSFLFLKAIVDGNMMGDQTPIITDWNDVSQVVLPGITIDSVDGALEIIKIVDSPLTDLPDAMNLPELTWISMRMNSNLAGKELPQEWNTPKLEYLDLAQCEMTGTIPDGLASTTPNLYAVYLDNNKFYGALPHYWASGTNGGSGKLECVYLSSQSNKTTSTTLPIVSENDNPGLGYMVPATLDVRLNFIAEDGTTQNTPDNGYGQGDKTSIKLGGVYEYNYIGFEKGWGQERYVKYGDGTADDTATWNDHRLFIDEWQWFYTNLGYTDMCMPIPHDMLEWDPLAAEAWTEHAARYYGTSTANE